RSFCAKLRHKDENGAAGCTCMPILLANNTCEDHPMRRTACIGGGGIRDRSCSLRKEVALDSAPRSPNGFLSSLSADDFELVRPYLRTVDLVQDGVLVSAGEPLKRAYLPHRGVISLVVNLAKGEHVQVAMVGRDSIFGVFS